MKPAARGWGRKTVRLERNDNAEPGTSIGMIGHNLEIEGVESVTRRVFGKGEMENWKKAVVASAIGAAAVFFLRKRFPAGVLASGIALAVVAAEYPEKFEKVRRSLPDYFDRGMRVMEMAGRAGQRITDAAGRGGAAGVFEEFGM